MPISPRLRDSGRALRQCYRALAAVIGDEGPITPAAEWLVDNFHVVDEVVRQIREDLPPGFYRQLPKLAEGQLRGYPRVIGIAWMLVAHTDSRFEPETLERVLHRFQRVAPLTIGELWAVPIALRLVLIENLRRLAEQIVRSRAARAEADQIADELLGLAGRPARPLAFRSMRAADWPPALTVQLVQRLRDQDPETTPALAWLDAQLAALGTSADALVRAEHQAQAAINVTVRNVITSLRTMAPFDWPALIERASPVDALLRAASDFGALDFTTRDRYRHAIEELARGSGRSELEVTRQAIARATEAASSARGADAPADDRDRDPGYYLISRGAPRLERDIGYRPPLGRRVLRAYVAWATPGYLGTIGAVTAVFLALPVLVAQAGGAPLWALALLGAAALVPASDLAIALVNRSVADLLGPRRLPRYALRDGIPPGLRTLVAMPTLLTSEHVVGELVDRLEIHYLANPDGAVHFALLSDWVDAPAEAMPEDAARLRSARDGIARLNRRHAAPPGAGPRFLLLHRRRVWNPSQGVWMGWERKRGKLDELNRLLRGATDTTFVGDDGRTPAVPDGVRYVLTLDADTHVPRGAVKRLVGAMAHPLNRPVLDPRVRRVVDGYGVLQPRITPTMPADRDESLYQRIYAGPAGIDPYAAAVSDVYQDLFGAGSYTGKGIYDVDAFTAALAERVPDNTLLSHDLIEGIFTRAGLVTDVELFEEFPSDYEVAVARQHRWARGDWQLLPWILGVDTVTGLRRTRLPLIDLWKMIDNLRRTLSAPAAWLTLVAAWTLPHAHPVAWTGFILATIALPALVPPISGVIPGRPGVAWRTHLRAVGQSGAIALAQIGLAVTLLAHQAWLMADAIGRTLARLYVTRRTLLEWTTAAAAKSARAQEMTGAYRRMRGALILAAVAGAAVAIARPERAALAAPFVLLWAASPAIARWVSRPPPSTTYSRLSADDVRTLRSTARRTWRFFETFVGPGDTDLPPDNFQEDPKPVVAHRTSPTNLGLYLLSTAAAHDFGWLGHVDMLARLEATLATASRLERHRGHFYNWYDTRDLRPLEPRYVSTVDSGNLAGHLLALAQACASALRRPLADPAARAGVEDALLLVGEAADRLSTGRPTQTVTRADLADARRALADRLAQPAANVTAWAATVRALAVRADTLLDVARTVAAERGDGADADLVVWAEAARATVLSHARDLQALAPWAEALDPALPASGDALVAARALRAPSLALGDLGATCRAAAAELEALAPDVPGAPALRGLAPALAASAAAADALAGRYGAVIALARALVDAMQFEFLFDRARKIFSIGYRVGDDSLDPSDYDLLASEARLASFVAIAKGDAPVAHWFQLDRPLTQVAQRPALLSWSGSMFEYLMPALVMRSPARSLLAQTNRLVVLRQREYAAEQGVPWGVSESAYNVRDLDLTYQYSNFGVPGLGLDRGLGDDLVIAPYATALAAMVDPAAAAANLRRLAEVGARGAYGFYEALDYTRSRLPEGAAVAIVRAHMAHHQGMTVLALSNVLRDGAPRTWFHAEPIVQATELLLQERVPSDVVVAEPRVEEAEAPAHARERGAPSYRHFASAHDPLTRTHLLSNGRYSVMLTAAGSGYSRCRGVAVTRWREDVTRDDWGTYVFVRDVASGAVWSAGYQPTGVEPDAYAVTFAEDRAEIRRRDGAIATTLEVLVSPEDDAEVRRVSVTNTGADDREIELTSYAELVLATPATDTAHPAFVKLFVETESLPGLDALLATRRARDAGEPSVWAAHVLAADAAPGGVQWETDRARFLGRGRGIRTPMSVIDDRPLSNTTGAVLDPIVCLRRRVRLRPGDTVRLVYSTLVAASRDAAVALADKYRDPATFDRIVTLAWTQAQVQLHHLGIDAGEAQLFQDLAGRILYADPTLRASAATLRRTTAGAEALWPHGISGDLPIVLVRIDEPEHRHLVRQLLQAHEYWRMKGLAVDLVILNDRAHSYVEELQTSLEALVRTSHAALLHDGAPALGGVFLLRRDALADRERDALSTAARAVLLSRQGTLAEQLGRAHPEPPRARPIPRRAPAPPAIGDAAPRRGELDLEFWNGLGGFARDGREYVTVLGPGQWTPAPWINVIANPRFGFQVSECGAGYTWAVNSRENKLTAWSNDPVADAPGEVLYVRDEDSGDVWNPTALPIRDDTSTYVARHGQGYSAFEHTAHGIALRLVQFVPLDETVKISRLVVDNVSGRTRRLSITAYVEWVLGVARDATAAFIVTDLDGATGALFARNARNAEVGARVAFADLGGRQTAWTADRTEFLGKHGTADHPAMLERGARPSGRVGPGLDPCAALQTRIDLTPGGQAEVVFLLGQADTAEAAQALVARARGLDLDAALRQVTTRWDDVAGAVQVKTPDRSMDLMLNRWLLYQTMACRVYARAAFYQAGGAYGFRDQLQDVMALTVAARDLAREHLLRAAGRQFEEGDVQHWWHPPSGRGVRTRIADDPVWLPYAVAHYVEVTDDAAVLDELVPFLAGPPIPAGHDDAYFLPAPAGTTATLFEHCARALDRSLGVGVHGLPLMGAGDWNDGMNRVGAGGRGESVWLGWFLHSTLWELARAAERRGEHARAAAWRAHVAHLKTALETHGWDGDWYRRAYFDDGTPLGSATNPECRIDSIAQSWAVLSGAAEPARAARAMAAVEEYLVRRGQELVLLFTPPFDGVLDPGYIRGYPPGIRENGGQYTHAAMWSVMAFAALGEGDRANELFSILNPINRASTRAGVHRYKVEPYVTAADVYAEYPHVGRGGWTWYTGSAGWMYRAGIEWLLGFRMRAGVLHVDPCIPRAWSGFEITFRYHASRYEIAVTNPGGVSRGVARMEVDGVPLAAGIAQVALSDDGGTHRVRVVLG